MVWFLITVLTLLERCLLGEVSVDRDGRVKQPPQRYGRTGWIKMVLWLSEWHLLEELLSVSGCRNAAEHDLNGSLFVEMTFILWSVVKRKSQRNKWDFVTKWKYQHAIWGVQDTNSSHHQNSSILPLWRHLQRWWSQRISTWSGPVLYSPCIALMTLASGSESPQPHSYPYSNTWARNMSRRFSNLFGHVGI